MEDLSHIQDLFQHPNLTAFLSNRWTLQSFLLGQESLWTCFKKSCVLAYSRAHEKDQEGRCLLMLLLVGSGHSTGFILDFDVVVKIESKRKDTTELAKTEIMGPSSDSVTKRWVIGGYSRSLAFDWRSLQFVEVTKAFSFMDHLWLWSLVQDFSPKRLSEKAMKDLLRSVFQMCLDQLKASKG